MDRAGDGDAEAVGPGEPSGDVLTDAPRHGRPSAFGSQRVGEILGRWQPMELRIARGFPECRDLGAEQLEDIYQETALALYSRPYTSEEHLRHALRTGIKQRALRAHRDERRRSQILARSAPLLHLAAAANEELTAPEPAVLAHEDRLIAAEFITELTDQEKRVFGWLAEGLQYRAIASALGIPENDARNTVRACERKRERFQVLYDSGRLCGFRAGTIRALQAGEATSQALAERAFAHLESCAHCRHEHKTNAGRLRRSFRDQAAALLPPVMVGHLGWLTRVAVRTRLLLHRLGIDSARFGQGEVRERAVALLAGGGSAAKIAGGVATLSVLAGGAVATHVLEHAPPASHHHTAPRTAAAPWPIVAPVLSRAALTPGASEAAIPAYRPRTSTHRDLRSATRPRQRRATAPPAPPSATPAAGTGQREPGGFAYLGVPQPSSGGPTASSATASSGTEAQHGGGQFSP